MTRNRPPTEPIPATRKEIEEALQSLTPAQHARLENIAWLRHKSLGPRAAGRNESDMLSDSVIAALDGRRKWVKDNCDFMTFLTGVMRSLASHIRAGRATDAFDEIEPTSVNEKNGAADSVERIPAHAPDDPERQLLARDLDRQIRKRFQNDPIVLLVYEAFLDKMKPVDIRSCLGITENEYNAAAKRLRRTVRGFAEGRSR